MWAWLRGKGRVDYQTPPCEPSAAERQPVDEEARIRQLNGAIWAARRAGDMAYADRLIDMRNAIRPARRREVPVMPGPAEVTS